MTVVGFQFILLWDRCLAVRYIIGEDQSPLKCYVTKGVSSLMMVIQSRDSPRHAGSINTYCMQADQDKEIRSASVM